MRSAAKRRVAKKRAPGARGPRDPVGALQRWFHAAIVHPGGVDAAATDRAVKRLLPGRARALEDVIGRSQAMTARERLDVYSSSYFLRLRDVLKEDFAGLAHALGDDGFDAMARQYVTRHPSRSFTLNDLGAGLERFLLRECTVPAVARRRPFLVELAGLERTVEDVFHAPRAAAADVNRLAEIPLERWHDATFALIPAHRLREFEWTVNRYLQTVYEREPPAPPSRRKNWLVVYRKEFRTWRAPLTREQFTLLSALGRGRSLSAALRRVVTKSRRERDQLLQNLGGWFREWTAEGLFASIRVP